MYMKRNRNKPRQQQNIAKERIDILFKQAKRNPKYASRYVFLARKIGMRYAVKLKPEYKRKFCHHCYHYFIPGKNVTVRTNPKTKSIEYYCKDCKKITRYGYKK